MSYVVVPVIGAVICAYLLSRLDSNAITLGVSWLVLGVVVLASHLFDAQGFGESEFIKPGPSTDPVVFEQGECSSG